MKKETEEQAYALRMAIQLGCAGAHKGPDGKWMPCKDMSEMERLSNAAEESSWTNDNSISSLRRREQSARLYGKSALMESIEKGKKRKPKKKGWEKLTEKPLPVGGIGTLPSGGLYGMTSKGLAVPISAPRDADPDVFSDPDSARMRARQLDCIGISRRVSRSGKTIWTPCTNMSDYARSAGTTALGKKNKKEKERRVVRTIVNEELKKRTKR